MESVLSVFDGRYHGVPLSADKSEMGERKWCVVRIRDGNGKNLGEDFGGVGCL